jgi:hypothetical protein
MTVTIADRIVGCLKGIAIGDVIGKQTEMLSREHVLRWYPQGVRGFEASIVVIRPGRCSPTAAGVLVSSSCHGNRDHECGGQRRNGFMPAILRG